MRELMEYIITGIIALAFAFVSTEFLLEFYSQAVNATDEQGGDVASVIGIVLLLLLAVFYFFLVWMLYASVQKKIDNM